MENHNCKTTSKEEAEKKWNNMPSEEKNELIKEFGLLAKPFWIYFAMHYPLTEAGRKL